MGAGGMQFKKGCSIVFCNLINHYSKCGEREQMEVKIQGDAADKLVEYEQ
jgi:hypothetical protein